MNSVALAFFPAAGLLCLRLLSALDKCVQVMSLDESETRDLAQHDCLLTIPRLTHAYRSKLVEMQV